MRWTPVSVVRTAKEAYRWIDGRQGRYAGYAVEFDWGLVIAAKVNVERFREVSRGTCRDGSIAELTTTIASVSDPQVLLKTSDTRVDLPRRRGTLTLRLPNEHVGDGQVLPNSFLAAGTVRLAYSGTICPETGTARPPEAEDLPQEQELATVLGAEPLTGIVQDNGALPFTITGGGALDIAVTRSTTVPSADEGVRIAGNYSAKLRITGQTKNRSAQCALPTAAQMRAARSLAAAQRLLRRHGITSAPLGPARKARAGERRGGFALNAPADSFGACGGALGTRRSPVLVPLRP